MKTTYTLWDELNASPEHPLPEEKIRHQLTRMYEGLHHLETAPAPTIDDWQVVSDAINMLETMVTIGICDDDTGFLNEAVQCMKAAGHRYMDHGVIRLDAKGIATIRTVLVDYADLIRILPARTMIHCHRKTEKRLIDILKGKKQPHDVVVKKRRKN